MKHFTYSRTNYFNIRTAHDKLDQIRCPFGPPPLDFITLGQGCDAVDQNCDCDPDDCSEDKVPPTIELREPIPTTPFKSVEEATTFLVEAIQTSDDCAFDLQTDIELLSEATCKEECIFQVTVFDARCVDAVPPPPPDTPGEPITQKNFTIMVDSTPAEIECGFYTPQDKHHVLGGWHPQCPHASPPYPEDFDEFENELINVQFWYHIEVSSPPLPLSLFCHQARLLTFDFHTLLD